MTGCSEEWYNEYQAIEEEARVPMLDLCIPGWNCIQEMRRQLQVQGLLEAQLGVSPDPMSRRVLIRQVLTVEPMVPPGHPNEKERQGLTSESAPTVIDDWRDDIVWYCPCIHPCGTCQEIDGLMKLQSTNQQCSTEPRPGAKWVIEEDEEL